MPALRERALACVKCPHLVKSRRTVVFGVGDIHARLMFVGEAPGADEDRQGEPFVGAAGQLLTRIIKAMGFTRETVYIANILKCRPDTPGQTSGNRKPTPEEMSTCLPWLLEQIDLVVRRSWWRWVPAQWRVCWAKARASASCGAGSRPSTASPSCPPFIRPICCTTRPSREAQSVGGHDAGVGKAGRAHHRKAARLFLKDERPLLSRQVEKPPGPLL